MSLSIHEATVPVLVRALGNLSVVIDKGREYAEVEKVEPAVLLGTRLTPTMFPLSRQVQIVSDTAKGGIARLAAVEAPKYADTESNFAELQERIEKTVAYLKSFEPRQFDGADSRAVVIKFPNRSLNFKSGWDYLFTFVLPNVYFHCTTAYAILRQSGVKVGKSDYLGPVGQD